MDLTENAWPPNIIIKKHPRAKYVKLKASQKNGLELVVPPRFNQKDIPLVLEENRQWIEKQLKKLQSLPILNKEIELPSSIYFEAIDQTWNIEYIACPSKLKLVQRPHCNIVVLGHIENKLLCQKLLIKWMMLQAKEYLLARLKQLSKKTQLSYQTASIRDPNTRWGSCSSKKTISLSYKLLFLPIALVDHILIHELCHTVHLNHSDRFWKLVASHDPCWEIHKKALRAKEKAMPVWL